MNRSTGLRRLCSERFDVLIVGGGATGLGCAVDAASRGYSTALVEAGDFAGATSSRSTKLVHGGVRYLAQGNVALVREALRERGRLLRNARGLVREMPFLIPAYSWAQRAYYAFGLRCYDALAGAEGLSRSRTVTAREAADLFPAVQAKELRGATVYWDAAFDDARLAIALAQTAVDYGAAIANYVRAQSFLLDGSRTCGILAVDCECDRTFEIRARAVINAGGIFADELRLLDDANAAPLLAFSRGSHLVFSRQALPIGQTALLVPRTADARVLFALPWHGSVLAGTTDVPAPRAEPEPQPDAAEVDYIVATLKRYVDRPLHAADARSAFAGLRPLIRRTGATTAHLSREHLVEVSGTGLVTVTGGKWTTYRKMAQDAVDAACETGALARSVCRTHELRLRDVPAAPDAERAAAHEMARTLADLLARRTRALFVDARAALAQAPPAVQTLGRVLGRGPEWQQEQLCGFESLAKRYIVA